MILKIEYKTDNIVKYTLKDSIDKVDVGTLDDGTTFINVYKENRKKEDDFETITLKGINAYLMNSDGKTLQIFRNR